jgi:multiple sugar transport system permease protein
MWRFLLHPLLGLIPWGIKQVTGQTVAFFETGASAMATLILIDVWQWFPFMLLVILAGIESLPREPFEAAMIDGASYSKMIVHVLIPLLKPVFVVAFLLKFLISLKAYDLIYTVTTGGPGRSTETLSYTIYLETFKYFWMGRGAAMALIFEYLVIVFGVIFVRYALIRGLRLGGK